MKGRIQYDVYTDSVPIQPMEKMSFGQTTPVTAEKSSGFGAILENAMKDLETLQAQSAEDSRKLALGEIDNIAQVQINALKTSTMLQTTVQLTSRAVGAYKEIMQMQV